MRSRSSMPRLASSSLDLVTMSCGLTLHICLIIALSFCCRCWRFGFVSGQVSLAWSFALCTQELYTWPHVLKERWQEERADSSSLNFFQAVFTRVVIESSQPSAAENMSPRQQEKATISSSIGWTHLWSAVQAACSSPALCTSVIRVLCQALDLSAFLVHSVLATVSEDVVAAHSSATDCAWKLA